MSEYDSKNTTKGEVALINQDITGNTTTNGISIDTLDFDSITFHVQSGALNSGTFGFELEESDDGTTNFTTVLADNTIGSLTGFTDAEDDATKRVGSIGKKQFQRINIVSAGVSGANLFSALAILSHAKTNPAPD